MESTIPHFVPKSLARLTVLLGFLCAFAPFSTDLYLAAFPAMAKDMDTSVERIQLTLSIFFFGLALGQLAYGPLSDRFGRRVPLMAGLLLYIIVSVLMVFVRDIGLFLLLRFLQALGGCAGMVIGRAVVRDSFDLKGSARVFTIIMAIQAIGPVVAPVLGAYLVSTITWSSCFVFMAILGCFCLLATYFVLEESLPQERRVKKSFWEILKVFLEIISNRNFLFMALAGALAGSSIFAFISGSPAVLMDYYGFTETEYGWAFAIFSLAVAVMAQLNFLLLRKFTARLILTGAIIWMALSSVLLTLLAEIWVLPSALWLIFFLYLILMSLPMVAANSTALAMSYSGKYAGSASSIVGVLQFAAAALISSLMGPSGAIFAFPMSALIAIFSLVGVFFLTRCRFEKTNSDNG
ncbi:MAG: multidrug effflux MFS transporter [Deltaproteobacteria bacterium]|jgi:DHA1 family bicyclomycin/chloramphenicol resistance-like MFS transporter|nr:multidrug effflux MFS transporter [Deltaproteobacteria bacterium]